MENNLLLVKIATLHNEYVTYNNFFESFVEDIDKKKSDIALKMGGKDWEAELEEFVFDSFIIRHVYRTDLDIMLDKIITYVNAARLVGILDQVPELAKKLIEKEREKEIKPKFVMQNGKTVEVSDGYLDKLKKDLKEQGNISKLIEKIKK